MTITKGDFLKKYLKNWTDTQQLHQYEVYINKPAKN